MNEDQVKGVGEKVKGKINEGVGKMTNDPAPNLYISGMYRKWLKEKRFEMRASSWKNVGRRSRTTPWRDSPAVVSPTTASVR